MNIALIEDQILFSLYLKSELQNIASCQTFPTIDCFLDTYKPDSFQCLIVDRFGPGFDAVEMNFPHLMKNEFGYTGKIVLLSFAIGESLPSFDFCVDKMNLDITLLKNQLKNLIYKVHAF